jgi:MHS family proline/betaine transporter-like MFS transporter
MNRKAGHRATWTRDEIRVADRRAAHRSIQGTAIGNFMEAYDFTLFSLVATLLAQTFYPGGNSGAGNLIATFGSSAGLSSARSATASGASPCW